MKILKKIKNIFNKKFQKRGSNVKNKIQLFLIIMVLVFWIFSIKFQEIQDFSAKIIWENFWNSLEDISEIEKNFLTLSDFLQKIKSWDKNQIEDLEYIYEMNFPNFWEILDEKITQSWEKINFYFEATVWNWGSIHEFNYEWRIINWEILEVK